MTKRKVNFLLAAVGLLALVAGVALFGELKITTLNAVSLPSTPLFEQTFADADGQPQPVSQWQGLLLVVNFWATWCAPCVEEMPDLEKVGAEYASRGVTVIGLAIDNAAAVKRFRNDLKLQLPLLVAGAAGSDLVRQLGNSSGALPYTVLVDPSGRIVRSKLGQLRASELRIWLDAQLRG